MMVKVIRIFESFIVLSDFGYVSLKIIFWENEWINVFLVMIILGLKVVIIGSFKRINKNFFEC